MVRLLREMRAEVGEMRSEIKSIDDQLSRHHERLVRLGLQLADLRKVAILNAGLPR